MPAARRLLAPALALIAVTAALAAAPRPLKVLVLYDARKHEARFLNPSGRIPFAVNSDALRPPTPDFAANRRGATAVSTPGSLHAWEALSKTYGSLPRARVLEPAIALAERGFDLDAAGAAVIASAYSSLPPAAQRFYGRDGQPVRSTGAADPRGRGAAAGLTR